MFMSAIFEQERFPFGEGLQTSATRITGDHADGLIVRLMNATSL